MDRTDISVIIPAREAAALLPISIAHLDVQSFPSGRFEIVVAAFGRAHAQGGQIYRYMQGLPMRSTCVPTNTDNPCDALNAAVEHARGEWVLFLDEDLVAGSHLVENHVISQERRGGKAAIVGTIAVHPQVQAPMLTKWGLSPALDGRAASQPVNALRWRIHNLSLPRSVFIEAGGFDPGYGDGGLFDVDLAWRLSRDGLPGHVQRNAAAYALRPAGLAAEQRRQYWEGRSLCRLVERTGAPEVERHFLGGLTGGRYALRELAAPLAGAVARRMATETSISRRLVPWLLAQRFAEGYFDARGGLAARSLAHGPAPAAPESLGDMQIAP